MQHDPHKSGSANFWMAVSYLPKCCVGCIGMLHRSILFSQQFGNQFNSRHLQVLMQFLDSDRIPLNEICSDIRNRMPAEVRAQLVHYLFGIAKADGNVAESELKSIENIANLYFQTISSLTAYK